MPRPPAAANAHKAEILERVAAGEKLRDIGKSYGVTQAALCNVLVNDPDYQLARVSGLESRLDQREHELEQSNDQVSVSRSRELLAHARWRCEREAPHKWGAKQIMALVAPPSLDSALRTKASDLLREIAKAYDDRTGGMLDVIEGTLVNDVDPLVNDPAGQPTMTPDEPDDPNSYPGMVNGS